MVDNEDSREINEDDPNLQVVNLLTKKSQPRKQHDTIGYSDDEGDLGGQSIVEDTENDGDSDVMKPTIRL